MASELGPVVHVDDDTGRQYIKSDSDGKGAVTTFISDDGRFFYVYVEGVEGHTTLPVAALGALVAAFDEVMS